ncbi:hypothetical protein BKA70DRAFT_232805 [Coprinopsis sp. MPI-PUGE-AT-0042]|nr:hypothetical protein BKA70DRAFT_232805 [Coprinopsis sp. MPI-PUGE-AT-0042]
MVQASASKTSLAAPSCRLCRFHAYVRPQIKTLSVSYHFILFCNSDGTLANHQGTPLWCLMPSDGPNDLDLCGIPIYSCWQAEIHPSSEFELLSLVASTPLQIPEPPVVHCGSLRSCTRESGSQPNEACYHERFCTAQEYWECFCKRLTNSQPYSIVQYSVDTTCTGSALCSAACLPQPWGSVIPALVIAYHRIPSRLAALRL